MRTANDELLVTVLRSLRQRDRRQPIVAKLALVELRRRQVVVHPAEPDHATPRMNSYRPRTARNRMARPHGQQPLPPHRATQPARGWWRTLTRMTLEEKVSLTFWGGLLMSFVFCYCAGLPARPVPPLADSAELATAADFAAHRETRSVGQLARLPARELIRLVDHYDATVRGRALAALIRQQAAEELLELLHHERASVRSAAPLALASVGDLSPAQLQRLAEEATSADRAVRESTLYALNRLDAKAPVRQASVGSGTAQ